MTIRDNRTGQSYDVPIVDGTIKASDIGRIRTDDEQPGLAVYDPGFTNTASCRSSVTYIDGDKGILEYRGYPIEQLAEKSTYLEVAYLLVHGDLPTKAQYDAWVHEITYHTFVHENVRDFMEGFRYDAHPMGMLLASVGALSTFYPESRNISDAENRHMQVVRLIAKMPTLGAWSFRHAQGKPYVYPENELSYAENFLAMLFKMSERTFEADERLVKALDVLFILHADHEQNCSTNAVRSVGSSQVDPYSATAAGIAALYGPLHGGANEAVLRMLKRIGTVDRVPDFVAGVKDGKERLMGFGHRVYKNYDPRAKIIKKACDDVFEVTGVNPLLEVAMELEKIALEDDYFVQRKLYPNVDFYSGLIYEALQFPPEMFTVLFAIGRTPGWLAQWHELVQDKEQKIARPKQIYTGARGLDFVPAAERWA
ncbi:MAG: citrate synthase [Nocardioidaceae bacterium]